jgi:hypothetical protein
VAPRLHRGFFIRIDRAAAEFAAALVQPFHRRRRPAEKYGQRQSLILVTLGPNVGRSYITVRHTTAVISRNAAYPTAIAPRVRGGLVSLTRESYTKFST